MYKTTKKLLKLIFNFDILNDTLEIYINDVLHNIYTVSALGEHIYSFNNYNNKELNINIKFSKELIFDIIKETDNILILKYRYSTPLKN